MTCGCDAKCLLHVLEVLIKVTIPCFSSLLLHSMCSNATAAAAASVSWSVR